VFKIDLILQEDLALNEENLKTTIYNSVMYVDIHGIYITRKKKRMKRKNN